MITRHSALVKFLSSLFVLALAGCRSAPLREPASETNVASFMRLPFTIKQLDNGLNIYYFPDHSLPSLSLVMMLNVGNTADPVGREGLAAFTNALLLKGAG